MWPSRWGKRISKDWPRLKSCQAVCDDCTRGEICSGQSLDAGCLRSWGGCVSLKFGVHFVIVLFLFATMGFHIARSGFFGPQWSCYKGSLLYANICQLCMWKIEDTLILSSPGTVSVWQSDWLKLFVSLRLTIVAHVHHQYIFTGGLTTSSDQNLKTDGHHFAFCWTWPLCNHASLFFCVTS